MASVNRVTILGTLGRDPEYSVTQGGTACCKLNVATNRKWLNKQTNEWQEETEWSRIVVWGKTADHCNTYLAKGRQVFVEGRLKTSSWDDKDGNKRYSTDVIAETVQFIGGVKGDGGGKRNNDAPGHHEDHSTSMPDDLDLIPF